MQNWNKDAIKEKLRTDRAWVEKAILTIYSCQTEREQRLDEAISRNGIGFTGVDAPILSGFARWLSTGKDRHLTPLQFMVAKRKMPKYWKQILEAIKAKNPEPVLL